MCGERYDATYKDQRTCGRGCGWALRIREGTVRRVSLVRRVPKWSGPGPTSKVWFPDCLQCGRAFVARSHLIKLCSEDCRRLRSIETDPRRKPLAERACRCGARLAAYGVRVCEECRERSQREARRRAKRRRRAAKSGAKSEPYTLAEIAARDRNVCQLCKKRVAMTRSVPDPKAPVIDHVLPLARGGDDTRANVQLAHFLCNSIKSARGSQQLALVG